MCSHFLFAIISLINILSSCQLVVDECQDIITAFDIHLDIPCAKFPTSNPTEGTDDVSTVYDEDSGFVIITKSDSLIWEEFLLENGNVSF